MSPAILATPDAAPAWWSALLQFKSYAILFTAAALATALATPIYILLARRFGWIDHPYGRKRHEQATPTMGGLVIFAAVFAGAFIALRLDNRVGEMLREHTRAIYGLIACTTCMILLGIIDDRHALPPKIKLLVQSVVALGALFIGFRVEAITLPWLGSVPIAIAGPILSLIWIVGITNAINLTDGLDGLAAGICLLASAVNAFVAIWLGNYYMSVMMLLLAGALLGFLRWNFHPARVFLGDTGALALGMYLALASLHSAQKSHTVVLILVPMFALGYPIFDTLLAVARRTLRGQPLFASDRDHIHHRLLARGQSPSGAAARIYFASLLVSLACIAAVAANHFVLGLAIAAVMLIALFSARVLGYLEWGGWMTRWSGREETRLLHAAAHLARLKIERAESPDELLRAIAIIAPEIRCREILLFSDAGLSQWNDVYADPTANRDPTTALEMPLTDENRIRFTLPATPPLDPERTQLIEELCHLAAKRLNVDTDQKN